ncbi:DUF896 domain-containing protein [Tuberibacillus sp. Marseille-P3662]|uniref:DUF896 domain-containing protein n=1 Tax=Tuberibacillus sp. Marseille-P3662 TaxID=1965358 RepID=UPI000A1CDCBC|nr:DUF896 domain-containing protein [Tuberibacillus sp. Marseille-P3662]
MLSEDKLNRISELGRKKKAEGLTQEESQEQQKLREEYLKTFRKNFKQQLHGLKVVDPEGQDVTPEKLKQSQRQSKDFH